MKSEMYSPAIQEQMQTVKKLRFTDPKKVITIGRELLHSGELQKDFALRGFASFCIGDAYYTLGEAQNCLLYLNLAMKDLKVSEEWELLGEAYNLTGILLTHQGNISGALDSYFAGMELAEEQQLNFLGAMLYENYSELCGRTNNLEDALQNARIAKAFCNMCEENERQAYLRISVLNQIITECIKLGKEDEGRKNVSELESFLKENPTKMQDRELPVYVVRVLWAHFQHKKEREEICLKEAMEVVRKCRYRIDFFGECIELMNFLKETGRFSLLEEMIRLIEKSFHEEELPDMMIRLSRLRIYLFEKQHKEELLQEEMKKFIQYIDRQSEQNNKTLKLFIGMKKMLTDSHKTNLLLQEQADTDSLTNIANRRRLNDTADQLFEKAQRQKLNFCVEMLDIDFFKEINDRYGHHVGDECLILVAEILRNLEADNIFCARYGGDEFFLLYTDRTDKEALDICQKICHNIQEKIQERNLPPFTVSQGVCNHIPKKINRVWDFTSVADQALYYVKNHGKNEFFLAHAVTEIDLRTASEKKKTKEMIK